MNRLRSVLCASLLLTVWSCHRDVPPPSGAAVAPAAPQTETLGTAPSATVGSTPSEAVTNPSDDPVSTDTQAAVAIVHDYYRAIAARDFERAYHLWGDGPPGQTLAAFQAGFADTESVEAKTAEPSRIEGAMGSRYIEIPTTVVATTRDGHTQRFAGTYTLRRTVVDGAPEAARTWHIYRASMQRIVDPPAEPR